MKANGSVKTNGTIIPNNVIYDAEVGSRASISNVHTRQSVRKATNIYCHTQIIITSQFISKYHMHIMI